MNSAFYKTAKFSGILPLKMLISFTKQRIIYPFYHTISDEDLVHIKHLFTVRTKKIFEKDIDFFLKHYSPIDYDTLISIIENRIPIKKNSFLLSFDDGLREFHDIIAPILISKGIPAICFLNSNFIDNKDLFFRYKTSILIEKLTTNQISSAVHKELKVRFFNRKLPIENNYRSMLLLGHSDKLFIDELAKILDVDFIEYLNKVKPYLDSTQISKLITQGFKFGSHSIDHPLFSDLPENMQIFQTEKSINEITAKFKLDYKVFSFPFTDYGVAMNFFNKIHNSIPPKANITFGSAGLKKDSCKLNIQRIPIEIDYFSAQDIIFGEYLYYIFKAAINKNNIKRN
jgi:peptidoglycan/xylan/chitin deacetylase (PgdA/CDA1 family)